MSELSFNNKLEIFFLTSLIFFITLKPLFSSDDWAIPNLPGYVYLFQNISQYISFVSLLILFFIMIFVSKNRQICISIPGLLICFVLISYAFRSFFVGSQDYKNFISIMIIILFFIYFSTFLNEKRKYIPYYSIQISLTLWVIFNLFLFSLGYGYAVVDTSSRFFGTSPHPNFTGAFACTSLAFFVVKFLNNKMRFEKILILIMIIMSLLLVLLSGSRSALFSALLSIIIVLPNFYKIIPFIFCGVFYFIFFILYTNNSIYLAVERMKNAPLDNRNTVWTSLINDFHRNPIWGSGDFSGVSGSGYLTAFGGTGLVGGIIFIIATFLMLYISFRNILLSHHFIRNNTEYCIIFIVICIISFFEGYIFDKFGFFQIFLLLSAAMIGPFNSKRLVFK